MSKAEPIHLQRVWNKKDGWFAKILRQESEKGIKLLCEENPSLYNDVEKSPIARRAAAQNCLVGNNGGPCPILKACARAGRESKYRSNVWGGQFKSQSVKPLTPAVVAKWMKETLKETDSAKILEAFTIGIPSLKPLLNDEGGSDLVYMVGECLSLRVPDPRAAVVLRRRLATEALLLQGTMPGTAMIELSCAEYATCISPWHMVWSREPVNINIIPHTTSSRCVALALYLVMGEGWSPTNAAGLAEINRLYIAQLKQVATAIGQDEPFVVGHVSDTATWYMSLTNRSPWGQEISALLTLARAGQELSCMTVREILAVGKEEF